jgi:hypothetical protein
MEQIIARIKAEPVLVTTFVGAVLTLLVAFGVPVSDELAGAIIGVIVSVLAIFARSKVTPV